MKGVYGKMLHS